MSAAGSPAVAVTTPRRFREKAMRITSVKQPHSKGVMVMSVMGDLIMWARLLGLFSLNEANVRMLSKSRHLLASLKHEEKYVAEISNTTSETTVHSSKKKGALARKRTKRDVGNLHEQARALHMKLTCGRSRAAGRMEQKVETLGQFSAPRA